MPATTKLSTDPIVFARDANNDLIIPRRKATGIEAVAILVRTALLTWRGEIALDKDAGTPWLETPDGAVTELDAILGQPYSEERVARILRPVILAVPGVVGLTSFASSFDPEERRLAVSVVAQTQWGDTPVITAAPAV